MSLSAVNSRIPRVFEQTMKKAQETIIRQQILGELENIAYSLLKEAVNQHAYHSLTGNVLTSCMVGIYEKNGLYKAISAQEAMGLKSATRNKLSNGVGWSQEFTDYDSGRKVVVKLDNMKETDSDYGVNSAMKFLTSFNPNSNYAYALVFTNGAEYAVYLEAEKSLDVISGSWESQKSNFFKHMKPI